eukprot:Gb_22000 [translate_table: standard]
MASVDQFLEESLEGGNETLNLTELPLDILCSIIANVHDVMDVALLLCSCSLFLSLARVAPFNVKLCPSKREERFLITSGVGGGCWTRVVLGSIRVYITSIRVLDLSGSWILDDDVVTLLADLKGLECLILDGCQKL